MRKEEKEERQIPDIRLDDIETVVRLAAAPKVPLSPNPWFYCNPIQG